jgi:hypothetical protein
VCKPSSIVSANVQARSGSAADRRLEAWVAGYASAEELVQALADEGTYSDSELNALRRVRSELSGVWVEVRVSGRGDFQADMGQLVVRLLSDGGYGSDDHSPGLWSLEEIRLGRTDGQLFRA